MDSTPPLPIAPEQRLLAAIVFTDVVSFSARMQKEETKTLAMVDEDFAVMRDYAKQLSGAVLKSTGDGLLLYFTSAVQAMEWALKAQRHFAEKLKKNPDALRHRVGLHLGDVFRRANDVMGDGVNIAARLQSEAPVGGICISQVVYDVVKTKIELHVIRLEARKLKNIKESIQMYHVMLQAPAPVAAAPTPSFKKPVEAPKKKPTGMIVLLLAIVIGGGLLVRAYFKHESDLARSQEERAALAAALKAGQTPSNTPAVPSDPTPTPADPATPKAPVEEIDFARLALAGTRDERAQQLARESLPALDTWAVATLKRYTAERPLDTVRARFGQSVKIYTDANGQLRQGDGGANRTVAWRDFSPEDQGTIIVNMLNDAATLPPDDVMRGAEAFAYVNTLPEMARSLLAKRPAGARSRP